MQNSTIEHIIQNSKINSNCKPELETKKACKKQRYPSHEVFVRRMRPAANPLPDNRMTRLENIFYKHLKKYFMKY